MDWHWSDFAIMGGTVLGCVGLLGWGLGILPV